MAALAAVTATALAVPAATQAQDVLPNCDVPGGRDRCNHWYTTPWVSLSWGWDAGGRKVSGCETPALSLEMGARIFSCTVEWDQTPPAPPAVETRSVWIGIDRTPPQVVSYQSDRPPDYNGWFNHPVGVTFQGSDRISGVVSCSSTIFGGPEGAGVAVSGSCQDAAGHTGFGSLPINYDATPPPAPFVDALPGDNKIALEWSTSPDSQAEVVRDPRGEAPPVVVYRGPGGAFTDRGLKNGQRYRYLVTLIDQAGNRAPGTSSAVPTAGKLLLPAKGERIRLARVPLLVWKAVRKADYYNVQVFRGGTKVLSSWPRQTQFQLKRRWRFGGKQYRLRSGKYCWYVWPGFGKRSKRDYGKRLGSSCFRILRASPD